MWGFGSSKKEKNEEEFGDEYGASLSAARR